MSKSTQSKTQSVHRPDCHVYAKADDMAVHAIDGDFVAALAKRAPSTLSALKAFTMQNEWSRGQVSLFCVSFIEAYCRPDLSVAEIGDVNLIIDYFLRSATHNTVNKQTDNASISIDVLKMRYRGIANTGLRAAANKPLKSREGPKD